VTGALTTLTERGFVKQCTDLETLSDRMETEPIGFYVGLDPTGPTLHIGHLVPVFAAVHMCRAGHDPTIIVGGGTARIGDPSGKTEMRKMLSVERINANVMSITVQLQHFLESAGAHARIVDNAEWLAPLNYIEFLRDIGKHFSVNRMLTFEAYRMRMEVGLSFIEFNYQLLQSYDFLVLNQRYGVALQIGGDDQWGNIVAGADLIRRVEGTEAFGLTFPLVTRADGKKMGKTEKGALFLDPAVVSPYEFFQYWRNVPDQDVEKMLLMFTFLPPDECRRLGAFTGGHVNDAKERLALEVTELIHGTEEAQKAMDAARAAFGSGAAADTAAIPDIAVSRAELDGGIGVLDLFARTQLCASRNEARRLVEQGGARINDKRVEDVDLTVDGSWLSDRGELLLRAGKKRYFRVRVF
jgi:tyrosyl-tRNA synthetase